MIRKTVRWALTVLGCVALIGGAMAWYVWVNGDAYAQDELRRRLAELAPSCDLVIGKVRFDWDQSLTVKDFAMGSKLDGVPPTLTVPEGVIEIDRARFVNDRVVEVKTIRLMRPQLDLVRRIDGTWVIKDLMPFHLNDIPLPEWKIEDGTLRFILEQSGSEPVVLLLRDANLRLIPADGKRLLVKGLGDVSNAGQMQVSGEIDLERGTWSLSGSMKGLSTAGDIAGFAMRSSAGLRGKVASLGEKLRETEERLLADNEPQLDVIPNRVPIRTVSRTDHQAVQHPTLSGDVEDVDVTANGVTATAVHSSDDAAQDLSGLGIEATVDVQFTVGQSNPDVPVQFSVGLDCTDGRIANPLLPFPLRRLRGRIDWDNSRFKVAALRAESGRATLKVDADFVLTGATPTGWVAVDVEDLVLSDRHDGRVPPGLARFLDIVRPSGPIDLAATFDRSPVGDWTARDFLLTAKGASVTAEPFPYPIRDIVGTVRQTQPGRLVADMTGFAGARQVRLAAEVVDPGPTAEVYVRITSDHVPADETLLNACPPDVRETLEEIGLRGTAETLNIVISRQGGLDQKYKWWFQAKVIDGVIEYEQFPYRLTKATGDVTYDSDQATLSLRNIVASHGQAIVAGHGLYRQPPELLSNGTSPIGGPTPGLDLTINTQQVLLDSDLRAALPRELQQTWDELRPGGVVDADAHVVWIPGNEPEIELTKFDLSRGTLYTKRFPYVLQDVEAKAKYVPARTVFENGRRRTTAAKITIGEFVGWHVGGVRVESPNTTVELSRNGDWLMRLPQLKIEDFEFESDFRRAMPASVSQTIESLNPRGRFQIEGRLDLRGSTAPGGAMTSGWNLTATTRTPATINAGLELQNIVGGVRFEGSQTADDVDVQGSVSFRQLDVLGQRLERVQGPFRFKNGRVEIGSSKALTAASDAKVDLEEQLTADYLGGILTFDAEVLVDQGPRYAARATLTGGSLERYAQSQPGRQLQNVAGVMNGSINLDGRGASPAGITGHGSLDISPAALYEFPVIMKILTLVSSPDNTAFRKATSDFTIHDGAFYFSQTEGGAIVLAGDAVWLIGQGRVTFDRRLELEFYNIPPKTPVSRVPLLGPIVGGVLNVATSGWMSFVVRGSADDPIVQPKPLPALDDGLRRMFESLGPPPPPSRTAVRPGAGR